MICPIKTKFLLWKTDYLSLFGQRKKEILLYVIVSLIGVAFGVYWGLEIGEQDSPYGVFASLFRADYAPFSLFWHEALRFLVFCLLAMLSFFLPCYPIFPCFSLFFFGKHFGELSCVTFLSDAFLYALPSLLVTALPFLVIGAAILIRITLFAREFRVCNGGLLCRDTLKRSAFILFAAVSSYAILLFAIHFGVCGLIYLLILAL